MAADLCLPWDRSDESMRRSLANLAELGYAAAAWSYEVTGRLGTSHACQIVRPRLSEPASSAASSSFTRCVRQHTRLTVHLDELLHVQAMLTSRSVLLSYDVVAVVPHSELALERATTLPLSELVDVISLPAGQRPAFPLKSAAVRRAVKAGIHFELCYSAALRDAVSRRFFVANLQALLQALPRKRHLVQGLLLSSGADEVRLLRSPNDLANLATLFGCHPAAAAQATAANAHAVLRRAARLRAPAPLASPPATGLVTLDPAGEGFGSFTRVSGSVEEEGLGPAAVVVEAAEVEGEGDDGPGGVTKRARRG